MNDKEIMGMCKKLAYRYNSEAHRGGHDAGGDSGLLRGISRRARCPSSEALQGC